MPVCTVCSGSDFICESGYYFCSECQTQSQDVREELNENDNAEDEGQTIGGKRRRSAKSECSSSSDGENMTSWEGFNFALVGLVDELVALGAKPSFKMTVLKLWTDYLRRMEVAFYSKEGAAVPKLGPNFKKYDANIIYGYSIGKRQSKKGRSKPEDSVEEENVDNPHEADDESVQRRRILKQKRTAIRQNYEKMMLEMSLASQTLTDMTLEMLAVSELEASQEPIPLQFNSAGEKNKQLKGALHSHPGLLVRNRLISLLYLGILVSNENMNLSDLLRWISEGHISYGYLSKFFPAEANLQGENFNLFAAYQPCPPYRVILSATQHLAAYIGLDALKVPSMKNLIQHYIKELNLPAQVGVLAERLLGMMPDLHKSFPVSLRASLPNWEGRAMAHIIIALKLIFGVDDATEHRNSRVARRINETIASQKISARLFVWDDWERFCIFRKTALSLFHKPTFQKNRLSTSMIQNVKPVLTEWKKSHHCTSLDSKRSAVVLDTYKYLLARFTNEDFPKTKLQFRNDDTVLSFLPCRTPYSSYPKLITEAYHNGKIETEPNEWSDAISGLNLEMLDLNFKDTLIDYLTHPKEYVEWAQQHGLRIGLHTGAAVDSVKLSDKESKGTSQTAFYRVKVYLDQIDALPSSTLPPKSEKVSEQCRLYNCHKPLIPPKTDLKSKKGTFPDIKDMEVDGEAVHVALDTLTATPVKRPRGRPKLVKKSYDELKVLKEDEDNMLHIPHTEYWMFHIPINTDNDFTKEVSQLPQSFMQLLEECASLIEMQPPALYREVMYLEVLHKDLCSSLPVADPKSKPLNSPTVSSPVLASNVHRCLLFKERW